jgi:chromosome segregation ATPase
MNIQQLDQTLAELQKARNEIAQLGDIEERIAKAKVEYINFGNELARVKTELKTERAEHSKGMADSEKRHNDAIRELQAQLSRLHKEIDDGKAELNAINAEIPKVQAHYDAIVRGINALTRQITNAAAAA